MTDDADVSVEVDGVHFRELTHAGDGFEEAHGHGDLDVALYGAGGALPDEHGEGGNQHGIQFSGHALGKAVVMAGHEAQLLVLDPLLKGHHVAGHIPDLLDGSAGSRASVALDVEGVQNLLSLRTNYLLVGDIVGNGPHLLPVKLLGVEPHAVIQVGLVDVQIHHTGVGPTDLGQIGIPEAAAHLSGFAPVQKLGLRQRVAALRCP